MVLGDPIQQPQFFRSQRGHSFRRNLIENLVNPIKKYRILPMSLPRGISGGVTRALIAANNYEMMTPRRLFLEPAQITI
jgi:hypothetical protein